MLETFKNTSQEITWFNKFQSGVNKDVNQYQRAFKILIIEEKTLIITFQISPILLTSIQIQFQRTEGIFKIASTISILMRNKSKKNNS